MDEEYLSQISQRRQQKCRDAALPKPGLEDELEPGVVSNLGWIALEQSRTSTGALRTGNGLGFLSTETGGG